MVTKNITINPSYINYKPTYLARFLGDWKWITHLPESTTRDLAISLVITKLPNQGLSFTPMNSSRDPVELSSFPEFMVPSNQWLPPNGPNARPDVIQCHKTLPILPSGKRLHNYGKIHHFSWENPLFLWPFSIAIWQITRGYPNPNSIHLKYMSRCSVNYYPLVN